MSDIIGYRLWKYDSDLRMNQKLKNNMSIISRWHQEKSIVNKHRDHKTRTVSTKYAVFLFCESCDRFYYLEPIVGLNGQAASNQKT